VSQGWTGGLDDEKPIFTEMPGHLLAPRNKLLAAASKHRGRGLS